MLLKEEEEEVLRSQGIIKKCVTIPDAEFARKQKQIDSKLKLVSKELRLKQTAYSNEESDRTSANRSDFVDYQLNKNTEQLQNEPRRRKEYPFEFEEKS